MPSGVVEQCDFSLPIPHEHWAAHFGWDMMCSDGWLCWAIGNVMIYWENQMWRFLKGKSVDRRPQRFADSRVWERNAQRKRKGLIRNWSGIDYHKHGASNTHRLCPWLQRCVDTQVRPNTWPGEFCMYLSVCVCVCVCVCVFVCACV